MCPIVERVKLSYGLPGLPPELLEEVGQGLGDLGDLHLLVPVDDPLLESLHSRLECQVIYAQLLTFDPGAAL